MELIRRFPLRAIRSEAEYDQAAAMIDKLAVVDEGTLTADEQDYLDALTLLISSYDDQHHRVDTSGLSPGQLIKFLMEQHGLSPAKCRVDGPPRASGRPDPCWASALRRSHRGWRVCASSWNHR